MLQDMECPGLQPSAESADSKEVEPQVHENGLKWSDVQPLLESVDSKEKLQQALNDPTSFLEELLK
jgi:hypothetical protein